MSGDLQRVELDDDTDDASRFGQSEHADARGEDGPRRSRRGRVVLGVGAALVVAGLVAAQAVLDARERDAVAALREVRGVLAPIGDSLEVAYSVPGLQWLELPKDDDVLLLVTADGGTGSHLRAVDAETGVARWDVPVGAQVATAQGVQCGAGRLDGVGAVVACLDTDGGVRWDDDGQSERRPATYARVLVHAQDDGRQVAAWDLDLTDEGFAVLDGQVAAVARDGADLVVTAHDLATGQQRWRRSLVGAGGEQAEGDVDAYYTSVNVLVGGGAFVVSAPDGSQVVVAADGTVLPPTRGVNWVGPDTRTLVVDINADDADGARTALVRDGVLSPAVRGTAVSTGVDDGSFGDVVFTSADGLTAWDATTGARRWATDGDDGVATYHGVLVARGTVYGWGPSGLTAFDRDGHVRWRHALPDEATPSNVSTDGERLYVVVDTSDGQVPSVPEVQALTFDGEPAGRVAVPRDIRWLSPINDRFWGSVVTDDGESSIAVLR